MQVLMRSELLRFGDPAGARFCSKVTTDNSLAALPLVHLVVSRFSIHTLSLGQAGYRVGVGLHRSTRRIVRPARTPVEALGVACVSKKRLDGWIFDAGCERRNTGWPCFGREREPTSPNRSQKRGPWGELNDRCHWGSLEDVGPSTRLITQRSLVQIQPPQPTEGRAVYERSMKLFDRDHPVPTSFAQDR